jgi:hypothetical protein
VENSENVGEITGKKLVIPDKKYLMIEKEQKRKKKKLIKTHKKLPK